MPAVAVAGNIHAELWGYKGTSPDGSYNEPFMKWLSELSNTSDVDVPKVFSTSYSEDEDAWSVPAATRMNTEFQKAGARGSTPPTHTPPLSHDPSDRRRRRHRASALLGRFSDVSLTTPCHHHHHI